MTAQEGNVLLFQTTDGGETLIDNGLMAMTGGLETTCYLSLFGGNSGDNGMPGNSRSWWANSHETDEPRKYISRTQTLITSLPATSYNLRRVEDAARADLAFLTSTGIAESIEVDAQMINVKTLALYITVDSQASGIDGGAFKFLQNWVAHNESR